MTKIDRSGRLGGGTDRVGGEGGGSAAKPHGIAAASGVGQRPFVEALERAGEAAAPTPADLYDLLRRIDASARALVDRPTPATLAEFRDLVREFVRGVVDRSFKVAEVPSIRFAENQKVFIIARKVDAALEALASEVLSGRADALSILARTDEIRGLLLDLRS